MAKPKSDLDPKKYIEELIIEWRHQRTGQEEFDAIELLSEAEQELRRLRKIQN